MNRDNLSCWTLPLSFETTLQDEFQSFHVNFGPQHPASHGVLRIITQLRGELIQFIDTHIGLLHRGTEKLLESRSYILGIPYFDRLDYTSMLIQEHAICLTIEALLGTTTYLVKFTRIRIFFDELTRILNHLIAMSTHAMDVGTMAIFFWAFEERERIMEFYERVSGARMHAAFYKPNDIGIIPATLGLLKDILIFCRDLFKRTTQIETKLVSTTIWRNRLTNIGVISLNWSTKWNVSGVLARSAGVNCDVRINALDTYSAYFYLNLKSFLGKHGDCFDRFLIRMREMIESIHLMLQITNEWTNVRPVHYWATFASLRARHAYTFIKHQYTSWTTSMKTLITHFKYFSEGINIAAHAIYRAVESAKGEFGTFLLADGTTYPSRCRIRSPAYFHTQLFAPMSQGHYFADLITVVGSQDIVMGEVDR